MAVIIRQATAGDTPQWLALLKDAIGDEYPDPRVYQSDWILAQFSPASDVETWVAEVNGRLMASVAFLAPRSDNPNPIANLGRQLFRPDSYAEGSAGMLLKKVTELAHQRKQHLVARVLATDQAQQVLFEKLGYICTGFQPFKHLNRVRQSVLFYVRLARPYLAPRLPLSESLAQTKELASAVLERFEIQRPTFIRDGAMGYPLQTELETQEAPVREFEDHRRGQKHAQVELSGEFNLGHGWMRSASNVPLRAIIARRQEHVAGLAYYFDPFDRCLRLTHSFASDDLSMGALLRHALRIGQDQSSATYIEVDVLMTAPRLLKTAEQLGFVPIAYLPEFYFRDGNCTDVVKLIKLNMLYSADHASLTPHARAIADIIDHNFQDQKIGIAIVNLLRGLPIFEALGDGELRKIARLFTQRLFMPGERIFNKGDSGNEAYVIVRGAVDILLDEGTQPIARIDRGQIFGELAFLDGAARVAVAVAAKPTILLIIQRTAFQELAQREPHLGMVVMRNIARELTHRLRKTNEAVVGITR